MIRENTDVSCSKYINADSMTQPVARALVRASYLLDSPDVFAMGAESLEGFLVFLKSVNDVFDRCYIDQFIIEG